MVMGLDLAVHCSMQLHAPANVSMLLCFLNFEEEPPETKAGRAARVFRLARSFARRSFVRFSLST